MITKISRALSARNGLGKAGDLALGRWSNPTPVQNVLRSPGRPLEASVRKPMETRFGHDFSGVRVHDDEAARRSADNLNARAYTVGRHVVFGSDGGSPASPPGGQLLAHELAHCVQQGLREPDANGPFAIGSPGSREEAEAERVAGEVSGVQPGSGAAASIDTRSGPLIQRAVRFSSKEPLKIDQWTAATTDLVGDQANIVDGDFKSSAKVHFEADSAAEAADWEVGFLQNVSIAWNRSYWSRPNADRKGRFLERKVSVPKTPLRDHLDDSTVWAAPGEFASVAAHTAGGTLADIPLSSSDGPISRRKISAALAPGGDASDGTDNLYQHRRGFNFVSFVSAHNGATDEWRHLELVYWSVQTSTDFAPKAGGGIEVTRDDRKLGQSKRFGWSRAADQPAIGAALTNDFINDAANVKVRRVDGWT